MTKRRNFVVDSSSDDFVSDDPDDPDDPDEPEQVPDPVSSDGLKQQLPDETKKSYPTPFDPYAWQFKHHNNATLKMK